jgi:hypothetical protein
VTRRVQAAQKAAEVAPSKPPNLALNKAITMLKYASDPELRSGIIAKMSADDALAAVEQIDDAHIRDALIRHSLDAD